MSTLWEDAARRAQRYRASLPDRRVAPDPRAVADLDRLAGPLPEQGEPPGDVLARLDEVGSPATVASAGGRYFGFVIGAGLPAAVAAHWLATAWNQNGAMEVMSPVAARLESVALEWVRELIGLPAGVRGTFVTGDTVANFTGLLAGRQALLRRSGWDVGRQGLFGAPPITVVVSEEVHVSVLRALSLAGLGSERVLRVPTDAQGRMRADRLPAVSGPTIVCIQAGNVNSGAFDPAAEVGAWARDAGAWVHVDGAFGLWAHAAPARRALTQGLEMADSWALDGHKWLNLPYDSGMAYVRDVAALRDAMASSSAAYLPTSPERGEPFEFAPEMSRRARGVDAWAALRSLGRSGVADLVERSCRLATRFAERLREAGGTILNEVVLNQVLVSFGEAERTRRVVEGVQREGTCWAGGTNWHGREAMRISVSSWATTEEDVDASAAAILRVFRAS